MKKLKYEAELLKVAITTGMNYAEARGAAVFEETDSKGQKILYLYRLFVRDKLIQPIPEAHVSQKAMRHKLAMWVVKQLPEDHPLLN
ncbi:MAG: DUF5062 family protein [Gammaproteobacteria bacterium]